MLPTLLMILTLAVLYWFPLRRWFGRWGTTPDDLNRVMTGDAVIVNPTHSATHAVTVDAPPEDIWPWLVQMGYRRGGLYSYDWLDRLFGFLDRPKVLLDETRTHDLPPQFHGVGPLWQGSRIRHGWHVLRVRMQGCRGGAHVPPKP